MHNSVTCVVVNYNGEAYLRACLDSIIGQSRPPDELVVVDNASTDGSLKLIRSEFSDFKEVFLTENVGYAMGCNLGIQASSGNLVALLNNDIVLDKRWLETLLDRVSPPWDFWASRILVAQDPQRVDSAGDGMAILGSGYKIGHGQPAEAYSTPREVFGSCGAAALYSRRLLDAVGGFDPDFFLIYEDADLNVRARLQGFRCLYVPEATVLHQINSSIGTFSSTYVFYGHRNSEYVFWKNMPISLLLLYVPERLLFNLLCFLFFLFKGQGGSFVYAKIDFIRNLPRLMHKRKQVQTSRKLSTHEFRKLLSRNWFRNRRKVSVVS